MALDAFFRSAQTKKSRGKKSYLDLLVFRWLIASSTLIRGANIAPDSVFVKTIGYRRDATQRLISQTRLIGCNHAITLTKHLKTHHFHNI